MQPSQKAKEVWVPRYPTVLGENFYLTLSFHNLLVAETYKGPLQGLLDSVPVKRQLSFQPLIPVLTIVYFLVSEPATHTSLSWPFPKCYLSRSSQPPVNPSSRPQLY